MKRITFALVGLATVGAAAFFMVSTAFSDRAKPTTMKVVHKTPKHATVGKLAPNFVLPDTHGQKHKLSQYLGKYVVLEWLNHGCPFVKKHYNSGNMQKYQARHTKQGVVWLSIVSSAPGKQGHFSPKQANALTKKKKASPSAVLLDPSGKVGRMYKARTTPHMYVINPKGLLIYAGAIDSEPGFDPGDIKKAKNYVQMALDNAKAGKPVNPATTTPYGCSVKYKY